MMENYIERTHTLTQTNCIKFRLENRKLIACHLISHHRDCMPSSVVFSTVYSLNGNKSIEIYHKFSFWWVKNDIVYPSDLSPKRIQNKTWVQKKKHLKCKSNVWLFNIED